MSIRAFRHQGGEEFNTSRPLVQGWLVPNNFIPTSQKSQSAEEGDFSDLFWFDASLVRSLAESAMIESKPAAGAIHNACS